MRDNSQCLLLWISYAPLCPWSLLCAGLDATRIGRCCLMGAVKNENGRWKIYGGSERLGGVKTDLTVESAN